MKAILTTLLVLSSVFSFGQKLKFKITGQKDTTVNLVRYFGKGLYYSDTAEIKNGIVQFDGSKQKAGIIALFLPGQKMLEFIYNDEEVFIEASLPDLMGTAKVKKSEENKIFNNYVQFVNTERTKATMLVEKRKKVEKDSDQFKQLTEAINEVTVGVVAYQQNIVDTHKDKLVSKIVKMSMDVVIPDAPKDKNGVVTDSTFKFRYFRDHFFDNIDLKDDRLVRTPIYHNKLEKYFSKQMMIQHWDTVIYYAFNLCDQLVPGSDMYQYNVSWLTSHYEQSKIMGMDKVFVMMGDRYYCGTDKDGNSKAKWMKKESLDKLCKKVNTHKKLVMGVVPPNITLRDTTDVNWRDFYSLKSDYTILYFWDPECGHCTKITPKLQTLYAEKFKERNIEIFAIGKAVGDDFEKWKTFVKKHNLEFINVAVTDALFKAATENAREFVPRYTSIESLNYQQTYDIYSTPKVFVLDKDKKIIAKSLSISQLEDMLDRLQGHSDSPKLFPPNKENPEDDQMH
ncbi:MAG TPA: redoxin domain-containing protein [Crocinitomicaceae bacterium]|nr:redoxin domain-containing protein [Crocinitomicaceae bacterium]